MVSLTDQRCSTYAMKDAKHFVVNDTHIQLFWAAGKQVMVEDGRIFLKHEGAEVELKGGDIKMKGGKVSVNNDHLTIE